MNFNSTQCEREIYPVCSYCASRVLKYNEAGQLIGQFGVGDSQIPHSLALAEDLDLLCVADRENMRYRIPNMLTASVDCC